MIQITVRLLMNYSEANMAAKGRTRLNMPGLQNSPENHGNSLDARSMFLTVSTEVDGNRAYLKWKETLRLDLPAGDGGGLLNTCYF